MTDEMCTDLTLRFPRAKSVIERLREATRVTVCSSLLRYNLVGVLNHALAGLSDEGVLRLRSILEHQVLTELTADAAWSLRNFIVVDERSGQPCLVDIARILDDMYSNRVEVSNGLGRFS